MKRGSIQVRMKIDGHEFEFGVRNFHSLWQLKSLYNVMAKIFDKAVNREAVKGAEEILKKGR